jgi:hypothetical protein
MKAFEPALGCLLHDSGCLYLGGLRASNLSASRDRASARSQLTTGFFPSSFDLALHFLGIQTALDLSEELVHGRRIEVQKASKDPAKVANFWEHVFVASQGPAYAPLPPCPDARNPSWASTAALELKP